MLLQKRCRPIVPHLKQQKSWKKHHCAPCIHWSVILRGQLYSHRSFVLLPLLSSTQLFPSNKYRTAHKQFVIGGNEFLIIETDNVLWHLEQCCSALLRARASPNVIIVATIIYQCQLGWGVSNWWMQSKDFLFSFYAKLCIPSTINIWKKVLTKDVWDDQKWAVSGRLACTSSQTEILNKIGI